ncbi:MAG: RsmE family RNA methyltransferase [Acidimicrobiia bacterium]
MDAINDPATALLAGAAAHVVGDYVLGAAIALHRDDAHHLGKARRLTEGERVTVSPGDGSVRSYLIDSVGREAIELRVDSATAHELEPRPLALAFAPPKGDRWELILRAGTELGVTDFIPLETDRGIAKWHGRSSARGAKIILEAMNQSRRCWRPRVSAPQQLRDWIESETEGQILLADTPHHSECAPIGVVAASAAVVIGPEGGFSESERAFTASLPCLVVGTGVVRTETAAVVAVSAMLAARQFDSRSPGAGHESSQSGTISPAGQH